MQLGTSVFKIEFLYLLDAVVRADGEPAGFSGRVCFGVNTAKGVTWWQASFGKNTTTRFLDEFPDDSDVAVGMGETYSNEILGFEPQHLPPAQIAGDHELLERFVQRYMRRANLMYMSPGPGSLI